MNVRIETKDFAEWAGVPFAFPGSVGSGLGWRAERHYELGHEIEFGNVHNFFLCS